MANNKMLIDATHAEETRVVVVKGNKIEEFDFEAANRRQLKGNIYLAKVTRVEPSLQAAFVDFGGNRHGFLAFSEIHPDYYQIPAADRAILRQEEAEAVAAAKLEDELEDANADANADLDAETRDEEGNEGNNGRRGRNQNRRRGRRNNTRFARRPARGIYTSLPETEAKEDGVKSATDKDDNDEAKNSRTRGGRGRGRGYRNRGRSRWNRGGNRLLRGVYTSLPPYISALNEDTPFEKYDQKQAEAKPTSLPEATGLADSVKSDQIANNSGVVSIFDEESTPTDKTSDVDTDVEDDDASQAKVADEPTDTGKRAAPAAKPAKRKTRPRKRYEIQQVIKRRQIILVQVVKEERGNKGAALTTYLSLAGRYCVLMPNTAKGGGISRKITNISDRKRLKEVAESLVLDEGMGLIVRTAGANRTKIDINRDYEYLIRLWENVRNLTLRSVAPHLVYEEGNLIKRSIRDLYDREIDSVIVSGEKAYKDAKAIMQMLMPSHAKKVLHYKEAQPIFIRHQIEQQLDSIYSPNVTLKSGGYLVINQTEALVSIDINSGKSTKENSIENTALKTNLEAAEEIARQLRLRDLAGLVVIDFIDMEESRNNRAVEKRMKDCLASDRARIQVGRISHFGLLEMSRQRLRASLLEGSTDMCPHCHGTGLIRSNSSMALHILNALEHQLIQGRGPSLNIFAPLNITMFLLNNKRAQLFEIENRYNARVNIEVDPHLEGVSYRIETSDVEVATSKTGAIRLETEYGTDDVLESETQQLATADVDVEVVVDAKLATDGNAAEGTADDGTGDKKTKRRNPRERSRNGRRKTSRSQGAKNTDTVAKPTEDKPVDKPAETQKSNETAAVNAGEKPAASVDVAEDKVASKAKTAEKKPKARTPAKAKKAGDDAKKPVKKPAKAKTAKPAEAKAEKAPDTKASDTKAPENAEAKQGWWSRRFSRS
ncbi:MAG: Rne/Rng family ribonuclease [Rhizobiales bacterium]|nr:Rne/Rng family ribonuclease [Hyphomicrobiales bacterium]